VDAAVSSPSRGRSSAGMTSCWWGAHPSPCSSADKTPLIACRSSGQFLRLSTAAQENPRKQKLQCSHYRPRGMGAAPVPCVVYCHCNSGSRRDAEEALYVLLPHDIGVFCLDFAVGRLLSPG